MNANDYGYKNILTQKSLFNAKVNIGQSSNESNPCMAPFIIEIKNERCIIDLKKTIKYLEIAKEALVKIINSSGKILFLSPEPKFHDLIKEIATKYNMPYILNNNPKGVFKEITTSITAKKKLMFLKKLEKSDRWQSLSIFEKTKLTHKIDKLENILKRNNTIERLPQAIFIIDPLITNKIISDSQKFGILIFSLVNTNSNPLEIDFFIPANNHDYTSVKKILSFLFSFPKEGDDDANSDEYLNQVVLEIQNELLNENETKEKANNFRDLTNKISNRISDGISDFFEA